MIFSKRSRYGIRALIDLERNAENGSMQLNEIADRNSISVKYLEQIFASLRKAGIIKSIKGPQGDYLLARPSKDIRAADIIVTLDGNYFLNSEEVQGDGKGKMNASIVQREIIEPVNEWAEHFFNTLTLEKPAECAKEQEEALQNMYYI